MPDWLKTFAEASPVTLTANTARSYALTHGTPAALGDTLIWIGVLLLIFIPLCVWRYRRMS
jgi:oleandomycin transport system permease protein